MSERCEFARSSIAFNRNAEIHVGCEHSSINPQRTNTSHGKVHRNKTAAQLAQAEELADASTSCMDETEHCRANELLRKACRAMDAGGFGGDE